MADQLQLRGGTTAQTATFTGALREVTVDTDKDTVVVHDNATVGGKPLLREDLSNLPAGTIDNADINASAAIAGTKISPDFGSQTVTTTGVISSALGAAATPSITFTGDLNTGIYSPAADQVAVATNGVERVEFGTGEVVFNDDGANYDFRIEGDTNANLFFVDASAEAVGIGTSASSAKLSVSLGGVAGTIAQLTDGIQQSLNIASDAGSGSAGVVSYDTANGASQAFKIGTFEKVRIDGSGRLLVGTGTSAGVDAILQTRSDSFSALNQENFYSGANSSPPNLIFAKSRGSAAAPAVVNADDYLGIIRFRGHDGTDYYTSAAEIYAQVDGTPGANDMPGCLVFLTNPGSPATGPTERMRIDSSGRVGIGSTPDASFRLTINGSSAGVAPGILFTDSAASPRNFAFYINGNKNLVMRDQTAASDRLTIDSSGRLLVGTSTARTNIFNTVAAKLFQVESNTGTAGASLIRSSADGGSAELVFGKSRSASVGGNTIVQSGDAVGSISFQGNDGSEFVVAASITAEADGAPGANDMPGRIVLATTAAGASSPTERMRINSEGRVFINGTTEYALTTVSFPGSTAFGLALQNSDAGAASQISLRFMRNVSDVGSITTTNTATAYNTSSDYRLKENVTAVTDGITRLQQLKPSRFNFIADPGQTVDGFIAHEAQDVVPEAVTGAKDAVDADGNPVYQGIDQSKLVPLLTAALQEAIGEIESLKARLTAAGI
jgi:hypothetical protein